MNSGILKYAVAGAAALLASSPASADVYAAPARAATGRAIILDPLSFVKIDDLSFGGYVIPTSGQDDVSVDAATGNVTVGTSLVQLPQHTPGRGHFMGAGTAGQAVTVTAVLPDKLYLNGDTASATSIDVALSLDTVADASGIYSYTIAPDKLLEVFVGGDLTIAAGMSPGVYSNEYVLTATYQ